MNDTQLKYFSTICEVESISKAAELLHISQPSLSNAVKQMETELGVTLFVRRYRGVTLTREGAVLQELAKDILTRIQNTENIMKEMGEGRKTLRLGIPPMIGSVLLPDIFREYMENNPDTVTEIVEGGRQELLTKLNDDYLDMVILPHNMPFDSRYSSVEITSLMLVCSVSASSELAETSCVTPQILKEVPVILLEDTYFHTDEIKKWFKKGKIDPNIILQTGQLSTMLKMISEGIAAGFVFRCLVENNEKFAILEMENPIITKVSLVWKKSGHIFKEMKKFIDYINKSQK